MSRVRKVKRGDEINPAPSSGVLDPAGRISLIPIHPLKLAAGYSGKMRDKRDKRINVLNVLEQKGGKANEFIR